MICIAADSDSNQFLINLVRDSCLFLLNAEGTDLDSSYINLNTFAKILKKF